MALLDQGLKLDLSGLLSITLPGVSAGPAPVFVAENAPAPVVQLTFGSGTVVGPTRKILVLSAVTEELQYATPDNATGIIGRVLADRTNAAIDAAAFGTQADNGTVPRGLLTGVTPIVAASGGADPISNMSEDLGNLVEAIGNAGIDPSNVVFVARPREAMILAGRLSSVNVLMTLGLPAKSVAAFAPAALAFASDGPPSIEISKEAVWVRDDAAPVAPNTSQPTVSAFQQQQLGVKVRANVAWAVAPGGAQVVNAVNW
jgi:hypothetical protein